MLSLWIAVRDARSLFSCSKQPPKKPKRRACSAWMVLVGIGLVIGCGAPDGPGMAAMADTSPPPADVEHPPSSLPDEVDCEPNSYGQLPAYCPCNENNECESAYCVESPTGKVCTETCVTDCPDGWSCELITAMGEDTTFLCVAENLNLCRPCMSDDVCKNTTGDGSERCISYGDAGNYCGISCAPEDSAESCPAGYECQMVQSLNGTDVHQCVAMDAQCACSPLAVNQNAQTTCTADTDMGTCPGVFQCLEAEENSCVPAPLPEACDGIDNDCDGHIDENCTPQVNDHLMGDGFSLSADNGEHFVQQTIGTPRLMSTTTNGIFTVTPGLLKGATK